MAIAAMSASAGQRSATTPRSSALDWEHIRVIGGRLGVPRTISLGASAPRSIAVGDFDGDGDADIVVSADGAAEVAVFQGDASGRFGPAVVAERADWPAVDAVAEVEGIRYRARSSALSSTTAVEYGVKKAPRDANRVGRTLAVVDDFDGDGTVDVAGASLGSSTLIVYMGRAAGGSTAAGEVALSAASVALAGGDFDGDGVPDLVAADGSSSAITLAFGDRSGGFARRRTVDLGIRTAAGGLAVSDIDGDGIADLVVLGENARDVNVFLGDGSGGLTWLDRMAVDVPLQSNSGPDDGSAQDATESAGSDYEGIVSLALNPSTIAGGSGATSTATITLNAPAPAGGVVVALTSSNIELAASVPSVTVPAGQTSASVTIGTNRNYRRYSGLAFNVTISASHGTTARSAVLSVTAQPRPGSLSSFDAHNEGQMCFGVGVRQTASGVTLEFGSAGNLFTCVPPSDPVGQDGTCTFKQECALGCEFRPVDNGFKFRDVCATTGPFPVAVNPKLLVGGNPSLATLRLNAAAPGNSSGILSSHTVLANTIPNLGTAIPTGATSANADVLTARVSSPQFAPIDGSYSTPRADGSRGGRIGLTWLALVPGTAPPFALKSFEFDPSSLTSVVGGRVVFAMARMNQVAPAPALATATMTISSSDPAAASIPQPSVTFTEGSSNAGVAIETHAVAADTTVTISASLGATTLPRQLTVTATPTATSVTSFFLDPLEVVGGNPSTGTVVLNGMAPSGGAVVTLESANSAVASVPPSVTVPAGSDRVDFTVATSSVATSTTVSLSASYGGFAATTLTVLPAPAPAALASLALNPSSVVGGNASQGTVTLTAAAPSGGAVVALFSSNPGVAAVPTSVAILAGATSASFAITTSAVAASTSIAITASFAGVSKTATLTVTPVSSGPLPAPSLLGPANDARFLPGQAITFDWTDVTGAASYTIQIDDSDTFAAPLIVNQSVGVSQYTNSTLPTTRMWWRVRANDAAGNPGAWSAVRRFEVKS
jgi:hypothetical protein